MGKAKLSPLLKRRENEVPLIIVLPLHIIISLLLLGFGYGIYIKKNYKLINSYKEAQRRFTDFKGYARGVGAIEFYGGMINLLFCVISYFYPPSRLYLFILGILGFFVALVSHDVMTFKKEKALRKKGKRRR